VSALRRRRAAAQLLNRPGRAPVAEVVFHLLAVQAQDLRAARLALRARTDGLSATDVDAPLDDGSLVVGWLNRGTLHLVHRDDYGWLLSLTAPGRMTANARRLSQEGVAPSDADRAVGIVERALADDGPLTRAELAQRIAARGIRTEGQATPHLLMLAALRGIAVLGPVRGDGQAYALARDWLGGAPRPPERYAALAELARRYLAAHGPASAADLAAWTGLPLRDARAGLTAIASDLAERDGLADLTGRAAAPRRIPPRLLPAFDSYLLGWKDRSFAVPAAHAKQVHPGGGMVRATATVDGLVVGTWTAPGGTVHLELREAAPLADEVADVERFLLTPSGLRPGGPASGGHVAASGTPTSARPS
jgi:Winged helix DNA-binding domain